MNAELLKLLQDGKPLLGHSEGGNSMVPLIRSRQPVDIYPADPDKIELGDIVIARVKGKIWCHLVSAADAKRVQISNNHGHVNGWTTRDKIYGIIVAVDGVPRAGAMDKIRKPVFPKHTRIDLIAHLRTEHGHVFNEFNPDPCGPSEVGVHNALHSTGRSRHAHESD